MERRCAVEHCERKYLARGYCATHLYRINKHGTIDIPTARDVTPEERFWRQVDQSGACWLWKGAVRGDGYGAFGLRNRQIGAHRFAYQTAHGPIPDGMVVMHACDRPLCVNPAHLSLGTSAQNSADAARKGRRLPGSKNHNAKLTEVQVIDMRNRYAAGGLTQKELAAQFGVSHALVSFIVTRKAWKHI